MQPHRSAEDVRVAVEVVTLVVNVLNAGSEAKIADDALNSAGRLDEAAVGKVDVPLSAVRLAKRFICRSHAQRTIKHPGQA